MIYEYNYWNKHIPRSSDALEPTHVRRKIGSQLYDGKSLKGKGGQKALLVAKVIGVGLGTLSLVLIPVFIKKKLYCKACVWVREVHYDQKLSIVHLKANIIVKDDLNTSSSSHREMDVNKELEEEIKKFQALGKELEVKKLILFSEWSSEEHELFDQLLDTQSQASLKPVESLGITEETCRFDQVLDNVGAYISPKKRLKIKSSEMESHLKDIFELSRQGFPYQHLQHAMGKVKVLNQNESTIKLIEFLNDYLKAKEVLAKNLLLAKNEEIDVICGKMTMNEADQAAHIRSQNQYEIERLEQVLTRLFQTTN